MLNIEATVPMDAEVLHLVVKLPSLEREQEELPPWTQRRMKSNFDDLFDGFDFPNLN